MSLRRKIKLAYEYLRISYDLRTTEGRKKSRKLTVGRNPVGRTTNNLIARLLWSLPRCCRRQRQIFLQTTFLSFFYIDFRRNINFSIVQHEVNQLALKRSSKLLPQRYDRVKITYMIGPSVDIYDAHHIYIMDW